MSEMIDKVARAIEGVEVGYHLRLTSLVDGISTYTLDYDDGTPTMEFDCTDDAYAHIAHKKRLKAARAAIEAMREPTAEMLFVGSNDEAGFTQRNLLQSWHLMIDEVLASVTPANRAEP